MPPQQWGGPPPGYVPPGGPPPGYMPGYAPGYGPGWGGPGWHDPSINQPDLLGQNASTVVEHLKRALAWDVSVVRITPNERQALERAGVDGSRVSSLMAWRRSTLLIALPIIVLNAIFVLISNLQQDLSGFNGLGTFLYWLPFIGAVILSAAVAYAVTRWTEPMNTSRVVVFGWLAAIAMPLGQILVPLEQQINSDLVGPSTGPQMLFIKLTASVLFSLQMAGILLSVGGGLIRGASKAKNLFPSAIVPGWILIVLGPVYALMVVTALISIYQLFGNVWLMIGLFLLCASPLIYIAYRKTVTKPMLAEQVPAAMTRPTMIAGFLSWGGMLFIVIFALTAEVNERRFLGDFISWSRGGMMVFDFAGRFLITTVVFALILTVLVYTEWQSLRGSDPRARGEQSMHLRELQRYIGDNAPEINQLTGSLRLDDLPGMLGGQRGGSHGGPGTHGQG